MTMKQVVAKKPELPIPEISVDEVSQEKIYVLEVLAPRKVFKLQKTDTQMWAWFACYNSYTSMGVESDSMQEAIAKWQKPDDACKYKIWQFDTEEKYGHYLTYREK